MGAQCGSTLMANGTQGNNCGANVEFKINLNIVKLKIVKPSLRQHHSQFAAFKASATRSRAVGLSPRRLSAVANSEVTSLLGRGGVISDPGAGG